jgi:hypothetical protein
MFTATALVWFSNKVEECAQKNKLEIFIDFWALNDAFSKEQLMYCLITGYSWENSVQQLGSRLDD